MAILAWIFLFSVQAFAALGADISSVQADQAHFNANLRSTPMTAYIVHELRTPTGMIVREFASASGQIFAVTWKGPSPPDLRQLLGSHFEEFQQAAESQKSGGPRGMLFIQQNGLVVQMGGHMRSYAGRAYLSDLVPAGVHVEELR